MVNSLSSNYIASLSEMADSFRGPFPYEDCRKLMKQAGNIKYDDLIPDLNNYFYEIVSHSAGAKNLTAWPSHKLTQSQTALSKSFFQRFPKYHSLESMVDGRNTPDLDLKLRQSEQMRVTLLELIAFELQEQQRSNSALQQKFLQLHQS